MCDKDMRTCTTPVILSKVRFSICINYMHGSEKREREREREREIFRLVMHYMIILPSRPRFTQRILPVFQKNAIEPIIDNKRNTCKVIIIFSVLPFSVVVISCLVVITFSVLPFPVVVICCLAVIIFSVLPFSVVVICCFFVLLSCNLQFKYII